MSNQTDEFGPIYGVPLIESLPLGTGGMMQAMPTRDDLEIALTYELNRLVAGYEALLNAYRYKCEEVVMLRQLKREIV